jgi:chromate transporter
MKTDVLFTILVSFITLSLVAVGGANSVVSEIHRQAVELHGWVDDRQFSELFAIAQASPGPNFVFVTLLGYQVAGVAGAVTATLAMTAPTCVLACVMSNIFDRFKEATWHKIVRTGLVSVTIGLVAASALVLVRAADHEWKTALLTVASFALTYWTRVNPLFPLGIAAALGAAGLL